MSKILEQQYEIVSINAIKPHPANARRGNTAGICESISENGFFGAVYVQRSSGHILAGKHRWDSAKREGLSQIPVIWIEVDNAQARKILAADNRLSDQATYNDHALAELLTEIYSESGLRGSGFDQGAYDELITQLGDAALEVAAAHDEAEREAAEESDREGERPATAGSGEDAVAPKTAAPEPKALRELLIFRPTWNKKRTFRFLSLRKWNSDKRTQSIAAFKQAKADKDSAVAEHAGQEIAGALREFAGSFKGWTVTAPPAGASAGSGWHMATEIAKAAASALGASYVDLFEPRPRTGGSHPNSFRKRGEAKLLSSVERLNVLLIDDISSAGNTLEECRADLLAAGAETVIPLSWVYEYCEEAEERPAA